MVKKASVYNCLLAVGSLTFTVIVLELSLRFVGFVPEVIPPYLYKNSPLTGWKLRSNYNKTILSQDGYVTYAINEQAIRSPKVFSRQPEPTARRIFLIGDSFTFGQGIDEQYTFARVLEDSLREKQWEVDVVNLGVPGFGTMRAYRRLLKYSELLGKPDLVIYTFIPNDPVDIIAGHKVVVHGIRVGAHHRFKHVLSFLGHLHYNSRLAGVVLTRLYPFFNPRVAKAELLKEQDVPIETREDFMAAVKYLAKMRDWAKNNQIKFVVLIGTDSEYSEPLRRFLAQDRTVVLEAEHFFDRYNSAKESLYLKEGHWNALGHASVAQGLEAYLLREVRWFQKSKKLMDESR